jgi:glyoxylase-like metal-dependent hydrolase (beta-lactamase superfamily II)
MKYNNNIYYYPPKRSLTPGSLGSTVFVIKGKKSQYFIDAGVTGGGYGKKILSQMEQDGVNIKDTIGIFLTHEHPDHIGGINFWRAAVKGIEESELELRSPSIPVFFNDNGLNTLIDPNYLADKLLQETGDLKRDVSRMPKSLVNIAFVYLWGRQQSIDNLIGIQENQQFDLDDHSFIRVVETPGHTVNHLAYLIQCDDGKKVLISGDMISFKEDEENKKIALASLNNPLSAYENEISSLKKISEYPFDVLFTSHYGYYDSVTAHNAMKEAINRLIEFTKAVLRELSVQPMNIKDLTDNVITLKHYLSGYATKTSTIYCILSYLVKEGKIERIQETNTFKVKN